MMPPRVSASGPKPWGKLSAIFCRLEIRIKDDDDDDDDDDDEM